jgi:hypothetical protein
VRICRNGTGTPSTKSSGFTYDGLAQGSLQLGSASGYQPSNKTEPDSRSAGNQTTLAYPDFHQEFSAPVLNSHTPKTHDNARSLHQPAPKYIHLRSTSAAPRGCYSPATTMYIMVCTQRTAVTSPLLQSMHQSCQECRKATPASLEAYLILQ